MVFAMKYAPLAGYAGRSRRKIDPRRYDSPILVLDTCGAANWGSAVWQTGIPSLGFFALAGAASAFLFIAGGLLAARLGGLQPRRAGLLLGLYYGGTGLGIVLSALLVPSVLAVQRWPWAWWALSLACFVATALLAWPARALQDGGSA